MKNSLTELTRFFYRMSENNEVGRTEVEIFLQEYLKYIFRINKVDLNAYDISLRFVEVDEIFPKRSNFSYKSKCNKNERQFEKKKILYKSKYSPYCFNAYFAAKMIPHPTNENKYTIEVNRNHMHAKNEHEFSDVLFLISVFGHEVHHIIQYIKHKKEMSRYDELQELNDFNQKTTHQKSDTPRNSRKLKRLINQHLIALEYTCNPEKQADKHGYIYLDRLLNEMKENLPMFFGRKYNQDEDYSVEEMNLLMLILSCQDLNEELWLERFFDYAEQEKIDAFVCKRLKKHGYKDDDLAID